MVNNKYAETHGHTSKGQTSPTYRSWEGMVQRCTNPKAPNYKYYGGRGILIYPRWRLSFRYFLEDMGERPEGMTLDRIDPDGDYRPENCKWSTWSQQMSNRRPWKTTPEVVKAVVELKRRKCPVTQGRLAEWFGVHRNTIYKILKRETDGSNEQD